MLFRSALLLGPRLSAGLGMLGYGPECRSFLSILEPTLESFEFACLEVVFEETAI